MSDFASNLSVMVAKEAAASHGDADRFGVMVERLAAALGFTVALACRGNPVAIDEMLTGAEGYAHAEAVQKAPFAAFMSKVSRKP